MADQQPGDAPSTGVKMADIKPVAWAVFTPSKNIRIWTSDQSAAQCVLELDHPGQVEELYTAAQLEQARREEREACAKICEDQIEREAGYGGRFGGYGSFMGEKTGTECAAAIRARNEKGDV